MKIIYLILLLIVLIFFNNCNDKVNPIISHIEKDSLNANTKNIFLSGRVVDMVFFPIYNISKAKVAIKSSLYNDSTFTDRKGIFKLEKIPPGLYEIKISKENYNTLNDTIKLESQDSVFTNYELKIGYKFSEGRIVTGFKDTVAVSYVFQLFDSFGLKIKKLNGFIYESKISIDSIAYVRNILASKPYLIVTDHTVFAIKGVIRSVSTFLNLNKNNIEDWLVTKNELQLFHKNDSTQNGYIEVPVGQEIQWARELRKYNIFRYIVLDYWIPADLWLYPDRSIKILNN